MTHDPEKDCRAVDVLADMVVEAIDDMPQADVQGHLAERYGSAAHAVQAARASIQKAMKDVAIRRRAEIKAQLAVDARRVARPPVQTLSRDELLKILEQHAANDDGAKPVTIAARNGRGEMSDDELRSLVQDILMLRPRE